MDSDFVQEGYLAFMKYYQDWIRHTEIRPTENREKSLRKEIKAIDTDSLREPWEKPWTTQQPKYQ